MNDPQELLAAYVTTGSEPAFTELVQRYLNLVYSTALRLTDGDTHWAEDVTQTVFADLARAARTLSGEVLIGGWLHRHACFVAANAMRAERRRRSRERQAAEMNAPQDHTGANLAQVAPELDEAINQLSDEDRLAILLRFFEQRDFCSVGQALGASEEAARKRVTRALEKLHSQLTRRGVTLSAAGLGVALGGGAVSSAPAGMAAEIAASALAGVVAGGEAMTGLKILAAAKIKPVLLAAAFVAAVATPLVIQHQSQLTLREENQSLRTQVEQLAALQAENERLSNQLAQISRPPISLDEHRELLRLRGEVGVLRDQITKANQHRAGSAPPSGQTAPAEPADIALNFPNIPTSQLLDMYQKWSGKTVVIAPEVPLNHSVWLKTVPGHPLTRTEAMRWAEAALHDQAHVTIVPKDDGSLLAVPAPNP